MSTMLWGKVYYQDDYAGLLQQEPGGGVVFTYDTSYLSASKPAISFTLPLSPNPYRSLHGLHPFFDNLVAEGWLANAQACAIGVDPFDRFALLLAFGQDLAGAVSIHDPNPQPHHDLRQADLSMRAAVHGRASLSGVQPKLLVVKRNKKFYPVGPSELSTHIAKLPSLNHSGILELEFLSTLAFRTLLPLEAVVDMEFGTIEGVPEQALIIERFDRTISGKRQHFEEFNQLLNHENGNDKYNGSYEDMGQFICTTPGCLPLEADRLYRRIIVNLLLGNTDAHFKNFAMFQTREGMRLTPAYDVVAAAYYRQFQTIALHIAGARELLVGNLKEKHLVQLSKAFNLSQDNVLHAILDIQNQLDRMKEALTHSNIGGKRLQQSLITMVEKRWNGSFTSIGQYLSQKRNIGVKAKK